MGFWRKVEMKHEGRKSKDAENKSRTFRRADIRDPFARAPRDLGGVS